jgi:hypothetical protein
MIPRIAAAGTLFSPLPCQACHGYMFTSAHRVEVEVDSDGRASAPPPGPPPLRRRRAPVTVTLATCALVAFHTKRVCTVQQKTPYKVLAGGGGSLRPPPLDNAVSFAAVAFLVVGVEPSPFGLARLIHECLLTTSERPSLALLSGCPPPTRTPSIHL